MSKIWYFLVGALLVGCGDERAISFSDLNSSEQDKYILKSKYEALSDYFSWLELRDFNIQSDMLEIPNDIDTLKKNLEVAITDNRVLLSDNAQLVRQNLELAKEIESQKIAISNANESSKNAYNEAIKSSQAQHYDNITELTKRINELEVDSVESIKRYEQKIVDLENNIDKLKLELEKTKTIADERVKNSANKATQESINLQNINKKLSDELNALKAQNSKFNAEFSSNLNAKDKEIESLKSQINSKNDELSKLMHSQTLALIELQNKSVKNVDELKSEIDRQRNEYFAEINSKNDQIKKLNLTIQNLNNQRDKEIKNIENQILNNYKKSQENRDKQLKDRYENSLKEQNMTIAGLNAKLINQEINYKKELKNREKEYKDSILDLRKMVEFSAIDANKSMQKISNLQRDGAIKDKEIKELKDQILTLKSDMNNSKKLANYELLNSKITELEVQNSQLNSKIFAIIQSAKEGLESTKQTYIKELENQKKYYEEMIKNIKTQEINRDSNGSA
ncbi:hypothetical protein V2I28_02110 [Campylobacter sp. CX2-4080-23]|uniref:hypothetical protein n=1 Tax=Campylobacter porcelli TaxID=1660073 RepID=UPI002EA1D3E2|nr:hypothetical protein [Campylobacter sp. CX2-4080-23]